MSTAGAKYDDLKQMLGVLVNAVLTPAGDTTNARLLHNGGADIPVQPNPNTFLTVEWVAPS